MTSIPTLAAENPAMRARRITVGTNAVRMVIGGIWI